MITMPECKSEASCRRQTCLLEEVYVFNMDNVTESISCSEQCMFRQRTKVTLSERKIQYANRFFLSQASVSLAH
jgi:septation ring formation regulator EzrA